MAIAKISNIGGIGGGNELVDINPDLKPNGTYNDAYSIVVYNYSPHFTHPGVNKIPVCGYKRACFKPVTNNVYQYLQYRFQLADNTFTSATTFSTNDWSNWVTIPSNAIGLQFSNTYSSPQTVVYSFSKTES